MLWPLSVVLVANTNGRLAIPALAGLLVESSCRVDVTCNRHVTQSYRSIFRVKWLKFRTKISDFGIRGATAVQVGRRAARDRYAKFHADRCHRRRDICSLF